MIRLVGLCYTSRQKSGLAGLALLTEGDKIAVVEGESRAAKVRGGVRQNLCSSFPAENGVTRLFHH